MSDRSWPNHQIGEWQQWLELAQKAGLGIGLWDWNVVADTVACRTRLTASADLLAIRFPAGWKMPR